jgi:FlaA1/EpsC-like NDP-sugar epimerase
LANALDKAEKLGLALVYARTSAKGREIYIWGTGSAGRRLAEILIRQGHGFRGFIDRDRAKAGQQMMEHPIFDATVLTRRKGKKPFIMIGSQFHRQIGRQLRKMGFIPGTDYAPSPFL